MRHLGDGARPQDPAQLAAGVFGRVCRGSEARTASTTYMGTAARVCQRACDAWRAKKRRSSGDNFELRAAAHFTARSQACQAPCISRCVIAFCRPYDSAAAFGNGVDPAHAGEALPRCPQSEKGDIRSFER
jgi:hypothetical protein